MGGGKRDRERKREREKGRGRERKGERKKERKGERAYKRKSAQIPNRVTASRFSIAVRFRLPPLPSTDEAESYGDEVDEPLKLPERGRIPRVASSEPNMRGIVELEVCFELDAEMSGVACIDCSGSSGSDDPPMLGSDLERLREDDDGDLDARRFSMFMPGSSRADFGSLAASLLRSPSRNASL